MIEQQGKNGNPAIVTDGQAISRIITETVRETLSDLLPGLVQKATRKPWLSSDAVQELTGWNLRKLQHLRDTRQIPFVQHGRKILYPTDAIYQFLKDHQIKARRAGDDRSSDRGGMQS